jgi:hypothetical protein
MRMCYPYGFPAPHIMSDRQSKQSIDVQLTPYVIGIIEGFSSYGMTQSQVVEWLVTESISVLKATEKSKPKPEPKAKLKVPKAKREHALRLNGNYGIESIKGTSSIVEVIQTTYEI